MATRMRNAERTRNVSARDIFAESESFELKIDGDGFFQDADIEPLANELLAAIRDAGSNIEIFNTDLTEDGVRIKVSPDDSARVSIFCQTFRTVQSARALGDGNVIQVRFKVRAPIRFFSTVLYTFVLAALATGVHVLLHSAELEPTWAAQWQT